MADRKARKKDPDVTVVWQYFLKLAKANKPLPTHKEYEAQTHSIVNRNTYNNAKVRFHFKYAKEKEDGAAPAAEAFPGVHRRLHVLATIPGKHAPTFPTAVIQALTESLASKGVKHGKLTAVLLADPEALEIREEAAP